MEEVEVNQYFLLSAEKGVVEVEISQFAEKEVVVEGIILLSVEMVV